MAGKPQSIEDTYHDDVKHLPGLSVFRWLRQDSRALVVARFIFDLISIYLCCTRLLGPYCLSLTEFGSASGNNDPPPQVSENARFD